MLQRKKVDTDRYHNLCNAPDSFSRSELEKTLLALENGGSTKAKLVYEALQSKPIEKPKLHKGGPETDYIKVNIGVEDAEKIIEELGTLEAGAVSLEGNTTPLASHYASLLDRWFNYVQSI